MKNIKPFIWFFLGSMFCSTTINATHNFQDSIQKLHFFDKISVLLDSADNHLNRNSNYEKIYNQIRELNEVENKTKDNFLLGRIKHVNAKFEYRSGYYDEAEQYFIEALKYYKQANKPEYIISANKDIIQLLRQQKRYDEMEIILNESIELSKTIRHFNVLLPLHEMAVFYGVDLHDEDNAISYGEQFFYKLDSLSKMGLTDKEFIYIKNDISKVISLVLGQSYAENNQYNKALKHLKGAEDYYIIYDDNEKLRRVYLSFMKIYEKTGPKKSYYRYRDLFLEATNRYLSNMQYLNIQNSRVIKDIIKRESDAQLYKIESKQKEALAKTQKTYIIWLLVLIVGLLVALLNLFKSQLKVKRFNKELKYKNNKLLESKIERERLFTVLSHELRTPVYSVIELTHMLLTRNENYASKEADALKYSGNQLLSLIDNVLFINEIEKKQISLNTEIFRLKKCVVTVVNSLQSLAENNDVALNIDFEGAPPKLVLGDAHKLTQILNNIIRNAIKFSPNGNVNVKVKSNRLDGNMYDVRFEIKDDGIGINKSQLKNVFSSYLHNAAINKNYGGLGVGLYVAKYLAQLYNSEIHVESEINKGSIFYFSINFEEKTIEDLNDDDLKNVKVLVVDDNKVNLLVASHVLKSLKFQPVITTKWKEALSLVKTESVDTVLMDINMPDKDGFEVTRLIREFNISIPIIAHTAAIDESLKKKFSFAGMNDYIFKPYKSEVLKEKIVKHLIA